MLKICCFLRLTMMVVVDIFSLHPITNSSTLLHILRLNFAYYHGILAYLNKPGQVRNLSDYTCNLETNLCFLQRHFH